MITMNKQEQPVSDIPPEMSTFELRNCAFHPNYKVEVYCAKEDLQPSVMCIKCYLDPEVSKRIRGEPLIVLRDLILKGLRVERTQGSNLFEGKTQILEQKYMELINKDHVVLFKRHIDTEMKKLDSEMDRIRQSLNELRDKFVQFFEKQLTVIENKYEVVEKKVFQFLDETNDLKKKSFGTLEVLLSELNAIDDFADYEKFISLLHKKGQFAEEGREGTPLKSTLDLIESTKVSLLNMKNTRIDTQILEGISKTL